MPEQQFRTTAEVFAVVKANKTGGYRCPIKGCSRRDHASAKDFGRHLAIAHKIPSDKRQTRTSKRKRNVTGLPVLTVKHCPNCGFNIEEFEQAAVLLRRTDK